jgi:hypothetical protein
VLRLTNIFARRRRAHRQRAQLRLQRRCCVGVIARTNRQAQNDDELRHELTALRTRLQVAICCVCLVCVCVCVSGVCDHAASLTQASERRTLDLSSLVPNATQPLLQQLEAASAASAAREASWRQARALLERRAADADAGAL